MNFGFMFLNYRAQHAALPTKSKRATYGVQQFGIERPEQIYCCCEVRKDDECELKIVYIVNELCFCNEINTIHRSTVH